MAMLLVDFQVLFSATIEGFWLTIYAAETLNLGILEYIKVE